MDDHINALAKEVGAAYDHAMFRRRSLYGALGFLNLGYWKGVDDSVELAQINLIETLVSFFPDKSGNVLDVACGTGASSRYLTKYFEPARITGINISERQLEACRVIAPGCDFRLMDAASLEFPDASFDNILCIEAAFHFVTRDRFFAEAYRVLKPGGRLAMSDLLHDRHLFDAWAPAFLPKDNFLPSVASDEEKLRAAGFSVVQVEDSTELCIGALKRFTTRKAQAGQDVSTEIFDHYIASCMMYAIK